MAYTKQNFEDGQVLTAEHLNKMEQGIADAADYNKLENRPFVENHTIEWDGVTDGLLEIIPDTSSASARDKKYYKVSDLTPSKEEMMNCIVRFSSVIVRLDSSLFSDLPWGNGYAVDFDGSNSIEAFVLFEAVGSLGATPGIYFLNQSGQFTSFLMWGVKKAIGQGGLPTGFPYFKKGKVILPETDIDISAVQFPLNSISLTIGKWYLVRFLEIEWLCQAKSFDMDGVHVGALLGNQSSMGGVDTGELFTITSIEPDMVAVIGFETLMVCLIQEGTSTVGTVSIYEAEIESISPAYLPKLTVNFSDAPLVEGSTSNGVADKPFDEIIAAVDKGLQIEGVYKVGNMTLILPIVFLVRPDEQSVGTYSFGFSLPSVAAWVSLDNPNDPYRVRITYKTN